MVTNVYVSAVTQDNISRHELLAWVNSTIKANFSKIEEMSTGAAYCQLTHLLFRDSINLRKVKWNSRSEMDHISNWKILGTAWKTLGVDKPLQVERLTKAKFQDNFEFLQWFYKFFNANYVDDGEEYDAIAARGGEPLPAGAKGPAPARVPPSRTTTTNTTIRTTAPVTKKAPANHITPPRASAQPTVDSSALKELQQEVAKLTQQNEEMTSICETLESERNFYFEKLRRIEDMCNSCEDGQNPDKEAILAVLYEANIFILSYTSRMESADESLLRTLKGKAAGTVAIFDKGDYYACYGSDAVLLATEVFMSDVCLKTVTVKGELLQYLTMKSGQYQRTVRELLMFLRYRIELYALDQERWVLKAKGTIGNLGDFEDVIGDVARSGNVIMAIKIANGENNCVSVCFLDLMEFRVLTSEFIDSPSFAQVEQCIVGIAPRECLVYGDEGSCPFSGKDRPKKLSALLKKVGVLETSTATLKEVSDWEEVSNIFRPGCNQSSLSEPVKRCLCGLYNYLKMTEQEAYLHKFSLSDFRTTGFMHIDAGAVRALELFSLSYHQDAKGNTGTLYGLLNKCRTAPGQRLLREWLARPLCDIRQICDRQDAVESLVENSEARSTLSDLLLPKVPDCSLLARKLVLSKAKLQDCYRVYQLAVLLRHFERILRDLFDNDETHAPAIKDLMLEPICYALLHFEKYCQLIRSTVDEEYREKTGEFRIRPDIDPELLRISDDMCALEKKAEKARKKLASTLDLESIKLDSNPQHGFFYRVTLKEEKNIRKCKLITILETNKGSGVRFSDGDLEEINERYQVLSNIYRTAQQDLEKKVISTCAGYASALSELSSALATIDVLTSLARLVTDAASEYVRPKLEPMGSGIFELKKCRHPVLEALIDEHFIPNDVDLGNDRMVILTGANMGGKSTYLRAAAISALLAQIGSFVPASYARLSVLDGIFTRVGASDQQTRGISTFMAEMLDCATILETATSNSLVIVDELGRGTSTYDGFGLAWAIANDLLTRVRCFCLFATHFHEMGALAEQPGAVAMQMSVAVENGQLTMLYEIRPGVAQSSFGIHVARTVGFPENIVEEASCILDELENAATEADVDEVIKKLKAADDEELARLLA
ncbi:MutS domain V protein [Oesophagostomum dentatum]|uniref:MutS domain V protein n=1 Tax=Oesophagostomum dentatum TaxID=61180 RepID=A0A0B1TRX5_OESDE|nr:MutS domain V protein [Oesophagostomum dentatum]